MRNSCLILTLILTRVVGDGGLEGNLIGYGPCNNTALTDHSNCLKLTI